MLAQWGHGCAGMGIPSDCMVRTMAGSPVPCPESPRALVCTIDAARIPLRSLHVMAHSGGTHTNRYRRCGLAQAQILVANAR